MVVPKYKRILIKLSGEALAGEKGIGINISTVQKMAEEIKEVHDLGIEIALVIGGGNLWRGEPAAEAGMDRVQADYTGMLGTVMNALVMADSLQQVGVDTRVQTAIAMQQVAEPYIRGRALRHLEKGRIVIFGAGVGSPYFSTDTTAALRAAEIEADAILMAKNGVDGVYNADPNKDKTAVKFDELTHRDVINKGLRIMDSTASTLSMDNDIDLVVFNMNESGNIKRVVFGEQIGTTVSNNVEKEEDEVMANTIVEKAKERMTQSHQSLAREFGSIRAGRANASLLDRITVEYYGVETPLNQIASITIPEARVLLVTPFDKSSIKDIERALNASDLGITPASDGSVIRLVIPALTEETRRDLAKEVKKVGENAKIAIRNIRRDAMDEAKKQEKAKEITEDELKGLEKDIQKVTDDAVKHIDEMTSTKEKELLEV